MRKITAVLLAVGLLATGPLAMDASAERDPIAGFLVGCCFGVRTAAKFNEGKDLHFREWALLIPYVGVVFNIWNGIDGLQGVTTSDLQEKYGSLYY
jgi:hypothetical protein